MRLAFLDAPQSRVANAGLQSQSIEGPPLRRQQFIQSNLNHHECYLAVAYLSHVQNTAYAIYTTPDIYACPGLQAGHAGSFQAVDDARGRQHSIASQL